MNLMARPCDLEPATDRGDGEHDWQHEFGTDHRYLLVRVVNAFLREDVCGCVSHASVVGTASVPHGLLPATVPLPPELRWLCLDLSCHPTARLWIPVVPCHFMQEWQLALASPNPICTNAASPDPASPEPLPLLWYSAAGCRALDQLPDIIHAFAHALPLAQQQGFADFHAECASALRQRRLCADQRQQIPALPASASWWQHLLQSERLAALQDHPFYPSARAKVGFAEADCLAYAPEFAPRFQLHWLAVPRALWQAQGQADLAGLIPGWPDMTDVGLPPELARSHLLLPVHPFMWRGQLADLLQQMLPDGQPFASRVHRAARPALWVTPTLSVRSLMLYDAPEWHIKLPLPIRTLGTLNLRLIAPSTIADGAQIQRLLAAIVAREATFSNRILLTDEDWGGHLAGQKFLALIVRRYPAAQLAGTRVLPVAALCAANQAGRPVLDELVETYYQGDIGAFWHEYLGLTLEWHLTLWLRYGIALESNQQNTLLVLSLPDEGQNGSATPRLRLLFKDNDAARIHCQKLAQRWPQLAAQIANLQEPRIPVEDDLPLAQMFTTITLQLNCAALFENGHWPGETAHQRQARQQGAYAQLRQRLEQVLAKLAASGEAVEPARRYLLQQRHLYLKRLLVAATLQDKQTSGARDINKFYGHSAPNFLREPT